MHRKTPALTFFVSAFLITITVGSVVTAQTTPAKSQPVLDVTSMDRSVDPCTDFFAYSCGGWIKQNPIPPDQSSWSVYSKLEDDNKTILREILESASTPASDRDAVKQKIGDYYTACMDEKAINAATIKPLQPLLDQIQQLHSRRAIADITAIMVYNNALFRFRSDQDYKDSTQVIAEVDQGGLGLPDRDYYLKTDADSAELRKKYVAHLQKMFALLGDKPATAAVEAQTILRIETALAKGSLTRVERRDPQKLYHKMTVAQLAAISPSFRWKTYFAKVGLPSLEALNVETPEFFKALNTQLLNETLANWKTYLRWHLINANAPFL
jgi:putative endopeptidase